jgi:hypothetical protein
LKSRSFFDKKLLQSDLQERVMLCTICNRPITLENAKIDENGRAVHEECYVNQLLAKQPDPPHPQHTE